MSNTMCNAEKKRQLREAFTSTETIQESLEAFKKMEDSNLFQESELGLCCYPLASKLHYQGNNSEKVLYFSKKALESLEIVNRRDNSLTLPCIESSTTHSHPLKYVIAQVLNLLGSAYFDLKRFSESLRYFERADKLLSDFADSCSSDCVLSKVEITQLGLFDVKRQMGKREEAAPHFRKFAEIREKKVEEGSMELGKVYKGVYKAYFAAVDMKEALPFCLKALEIYRKHLGCDSMVVAEIMADLGVIYEELCEYEKVLEISQLVQSVMKKVAPNSLELMEVELVIGSMLCVMGRNEEAIEIFRVVASNPVVKGSYEASTFNFMARASLGLGKFDDAKVYLRRARRIYEKEEMDHLSFACGFGEMSALYAKMNDRETAMLFARRVIDIPRIPHKLLLQSFSRLIILISLVGKEEEAIPYMEVAIKKLEDSVGSKHYKVGFGCKLLGAAYIKSDQLELAIKCFTKAKEIIDVSRGPNHLESLRTSHSLARAYALMKRVEPALAIEEKVVEGLKLLGPSEQVLLDEAVKLLKRLNTIKEIMAGPTGSTINDLFPNLML